jgi:hypothetical protein
MQHQQSHLQQLTQQCNHDTCTCSKSVTLHQSLTDGSGSSLIDLPNCTSLNDIQLDELLDDPSSNAWVFAARLTIPDKCTNLSIATKFIMNYAEYSGASLSKHLSVTILFQLPPLSFMSRCTVILHQNRINIGVIVGYYQPTSL